MLGMRQIYPGKYEPALLLELLARHRVTFSHCVPTILQMLLHHPAANTVDWKQLKLVIGGAALTSAMAREAQDHGIRILGGYGMSETCPIVAIAQVKPAEVGLDAESKLGVVTRSGFPLPLVQVAVLDAQDQPLPPGPQQIGELALRSPWLTQGYLDNPEASANLWRGGWMHTGDIAYQDTDGYIRITDRLKDVIKIGGEWMSSLELESALARHPAVREVAVIGVPDTKWGERPHAEVVLRDGLSEPVTVRDLQKHLHAAVDAGTLHQRAILTQLVLTEALPRTSVGKLDKKALRTRLAAPQAATNPQATPGS
jgi:fatty-acyl-CoA synthase